MGSVADPEFTMMKPLTQEDLKYLSIRYRSVLRDMSLARECNDILFATYMREICDTPKDQWWLCCSDPKAFAERWKKLCRTWGYPKGKSLPKNLSLAVPACVVYKPGFLKG